MTYIRISIVITILLINRGIAQSFQNVQNDSLSLLSALNEVLFPPDYPKINAYLHPLCMNKEIEGYEFNRISNVDSSVMVRVSQPDAILVNDLLLKIAMTRDYRYFAPLMEMYQCR